MLRNVHTLQTLNRHSTTSWDLPYTHYSLRHLDKQSIPEKFVDLADHPPFLWATCSDRNTNSEYRYSCKIPILHSQHAQVPSPPKHTNSDLGYIPHVVRPLPICNVSQGKNKTAMNTGPVASHILSAKVKASFVLQEWSTGTDKDYKSLVQ